MKIVFTSILFIITGSITAQNWFGKKLQGNKQVETITREVRHFNQLTVLGPFHVTLIPSDEEKLVIDIEDNLTAFLETKVKGKSLSIQWEKYAKIKPNKKIKIQLYYKALKSVDLIGSGSIKNEEVLTSDDFNMDVVGSGVINIYIQAQEVTCSLSGSGEIQVQGEAVEFEVEKAGSGDVYAGDFSCKEVNISTVGSGNATVFASESLKAKLVGSGTVYYKGNPKEIDTSVGGSGSVIMK